MTTFFLFPSGAEGFAMPPDEKDVADFFNRQVAGADQETFLRALHNLALRAVFWGECLKEHQVNPDRLFQKFFHEADPATEKLLTQKAIWTVAASLEAAKAKQDKSRH